jgi:hypothetical protein
MANARFYFPWQIHAVHILPWQIHVYHGLNAMHDHTCVRIAQSCNLSNGCTDICTECAENDRKCTKCVRKCTKCEKIAHFVDISA